MISSLLLGPSHFLFFCHNRFLRSFACLPVFSGLQIFPLLATPISQSTPLHCPVVPNSNPALYSSALRLFKLLTLSVLQSLCHRIVVWMKCSSLGRALEALSGASQCCVIVGLGILPQVLLCHATSYFWPAEDLIFPRLRLQAHLCYLRSGSICKLAPTGFL